MYPPSMLSSAALAHSAQEMEKEVGLGPDLDTAELIARLQILTRVENVSTQKIFCNLQKIFYPLWSVAA